VTSDTVSMKFMT